MSFSRHSRRAILKEQNILLHLSLFAATLLTTIAAGVFWAGAAISFTTFTTFTTSLQPGIPYALSLLLFLSVHEFGHFFAALHNRIRTTLPYFIPLPPLPMLLGIGTMGAVIRIRERINGSSALFDIGAAGPLSGFAICLGLLLYGFLNLPPAEFIFTIHPEYIAAGGLPATPPEGTLQLGKNLLWLLLENTLPTRNLPPMTEMYHYPFLFTGWLGCFVTALNLLPVGQLDGGHITYAMFGKKGHRTAGRIVLTLITLLALPSLLELAAALTPLIPASLLPTALLHLSWPGWILWVFILIRFIGISHPPTMNDHPISTGRTIIGWIAILVFILTFTPLPFSIT
ncbi:MAG: site-2 protease family protein [Chlorobium sp.]|nr:site-2 protease family protein [Chlorobium phaeovibrioides]NQU46504.1 site-2 protease family protein [Chlorobium sp.]